MWEEANPGFKADLQWGMDTSDWGQYASQLLTKFAAGEQMDTTYCAVEGVAFLADNGAVDSFVIFDTQDDNSFRLALENVINIITGE